MSSEQRCVQSSPQTLSFAASRIAFRPELLMEQDGQARKGRTIAGFVRNEASDVNQKAVSGRAKLERLSLRSRN